MISEIMDDFIELEREIGKSIQLADLAFDSNEVFGGEYENVIKKLCKKYGILYNYEEVCEVVEFSDFMEDKEQEIETELLIRLGY